MAKATKEIEKKLENIGLNIEKVPACLSKRESIKFRASKTYDDTSYKIYKYIISIFIFNFINWGL